VRPETDLGQADLRGRRHETKIAAQGQFAASAYRRAVDDRHGRLRQHAEIDRARILLPCGGLLGRGDLEIGPARGRFPA
jgi:hypothetical protein